MGDGFDQEKAGILREGFAEAARQDGATTGQVPAVAADGQMKFVAAGGGSQPIQTATVHMTASDIEASRSTPFELVTVPAGKIFHPVSDSVAHYFFGTVPYFGSGMRLSLGGSNFDTIPTIFGTVDQTSFVPFGGIDLTLSAAGLPLTVSADLSIGLINTFAITAGNAGVGYAPGDGILVSGGGGSSGDFTVATVGGGGGVLTLTQTNAGQDYSVGTGYATLTGGSGTGLEIDVLTIREGAGDGTLLWQVFYGLLDLP